VRWSFVLVVLALVVGSATVLTHAATPPPGIVRYAAGRLTVSVTAMPLDRLLGELAAVTHATIRGAVDPRSITIDFKDAPLSDGLTRIFGAESFMLTYANDGTIRTIELLGKGAPPSSTPAVRSAPSPAAPFAEEEAQAVVLQRPLTVSGPLAAVVGSEHPPIGRVLHAAVHEEDAAVRAAARDAVLVAFAEDPDAEAAYLSTLTPVDDAVLATILRGRGPKGAAEEWLAALAARAPSAELRRKAAEVLTVLER
jgi:hypothetical protein